jgi:hypothetical protein
VSAAYILVGIMCNAGILLIMFVIIYLQVLKLLMPITMRKIRMDAMVEVIPVGIRFVTLLQGRIVEHVRRIAVTACAAYNDCAIRHILDEAMPLGHLRLGGMGRVA